MKYTKKYTKNEIGELPSDCINVTKFIKTNFSLDFYCEIICLSQIFATNFSEYNNETYMIYILSMYWYNFHSLTNNI